VVLPQAHANSSHPVSEHLGLVNLHERNGIASLLVLEAEDPIRRTQREARECEHPCTLRGLGVRNLVSIAANELGDDALTIWNVLISRRVTTDCSFSLEVLDHRLMT